MLLGDFYKITESGIEGQSISAKIEFNKEHAIFKGHFPQLPAVPGVCQAQILQEILNYVLKRELRLAIASHIKFLALVNPEVNNQLQVDIKMADEVNGKFAIAASYFWGDTIFFRFKGEFQNDR